MTTVPTFSASELFAIFDRIGDWIFTAGIIIAPIMIIIGAFVFLTGGDDPNRVASGKKILMWAVIGLILIVMARGLFMAFRSIIGG